MEGRRTGIAFGVTVLLFVAWGGVESAPPEIVNSDVKILEQTVANVEYTLAQARLEFDQDLYLSQPFLCGHAEEECSHQEVPEGCTLCDLTDSTAACSTDNCCSPLGVDPDYCDNPPDFVKLVEGVPSEVVALREGETKYFRFFVGEEHRCQPFYISARPYYGTVDLYMARLWRAYPTGGGADWRRRTQFFNYGKASLLVCPTHTFYGLGTYTLAVFASVDAEFHVELSFPPADSLPLPPPEESIPCSSVPDSVMNQFAQTLPNGAEKVILCLEDGVTTTINYGGEYRNQLTELILPVPKGCHTLSIAVTTPYGGADPDLYCLPTNPNAEVSSSNAAITSYNGYDDQLLIRACFDEDTYVHCANQVFSTGLVDHIWSSTAPVLSQRLADVTPASASFQQGMAAAVGVVQNGAFQACADFASDCNFWISYPLQDPLAYWPPVYNDEVIEGVYTKPYPPEALVEAGLTTVNPRLLVINAFLTKGARRIYSIEEFVQNGTFAVIGVGNVDGEPVILPNDGPRNGLLGSFNEYIPNIAVSNLTVRDMAVECSYDSFLSHKAMVDDQVSKVLTAQGVGAILPAQYTIDSLNAAAPRETCVQAARDLAISDLVNLSIADARFCQYDIDTSPDEFANDPCCNGQLEATACCEYDLYQVSEQLMVENSEVLEADCGIPQCATTFMDDLIRAINNLNDAVQGCASGISSFRGQLGLLREELFDSTVRYCAQEAGLGKLHAGIPCGSDADCPGTLSGCDVANGICAVESREAIENDYLACYAERIPDFVVEYMRENVFEGFDQLVQRGTDKFLEVLRKYYSTTDCVSTTRALDFTQSNRFAFEIPFDFGGITGEDCRAILAWDQGAHFQFRPPIVNEKDARVACPDVQCLGDSCRPNERVCYEFCANDFVEVRVTEESCPDDLRCVLGGEPTDCNGQSECVYCPTDGSDCVLAPFASETECQENTVCVLPSGAVQFGLTDEECEALDASCSEECAGVPTCKAFRPFLDGVCAVNGVPYLVPVAGMVGVSTEEECAALAVELGAPTSYHRCSDYALDECDWGRAGDFSVLDPIKSALECYVDSYGPCPDRESCETTGKCSDYEWHTTIYRDIPAPQVNRLAGVCMNSGYHEREFLEGYPWCWSNDVKAPIGCYPYYFPFFTITEPECTDEIITPDSHLLHQRWMSPATTEEECLADEIGRKGCLLPSTTYEGNVAWLLWLNEDDCECRGGQFRNGYTWSPGRWRGGRVIPLEWRQFEAQREYEWRDDALDLLALENAVIQGLEEQFLYNVKSETLCTSNLISSQLGTVVCDCVGDDAPRDTTCYFTDLSNIGVEVGIQDICAGVERVLKGPSTILRFYEWSVTRGCSLGQLSTLESSWFATSRSSAKVSFQFERKDQPDSLVVNRRGAVVGELVGDGAEVVFEDPEIVQVFEACLLLDELAVAEYEDFYPILDVGFSTDSLDSIVPLDFDVNIVQLQESNFLCSTVQVSQIRDGTDVVRLFPILRVVDWTDVETDYFDDTTEALIYTLAVLYIIDFFLLAIFLGILIRENLRTRKSMPIVAWIAVFFVVLCIFRIVFLFMLVQGEFEDDSLAEYALFEIPTFILFTIVIMANGFWRKLSRKSAFFVNDTDMQLWVMVGIAIFLIWLLYAVVLIIYSEVILDGFDEESPCPGRVAASNKDQEDATRTLSIVYQSVVIFITFILACMFWYSSYKLFKMTSKGVSRAKQFIFRIGALIVSAFMLRCILFLIILAADFESSIYMFITLFLTEVLLMFLIQLEFNKRFYWRIFGGTASRILPSGMNLTMTRGSTGGSQMGSSTPSRSGSASLSTDLSAQMDD